MATSGSDVDGLRCATRSRHLEEALTATASTVRTWVLLEQPGSWPYRALETRGLPPGIGRDLAAKANRAGVRLVLVRRPGRSAPAASRSVFVAHAREINPWLATTVVAEPQDVLDLDFDAFAQGSTTGLDPVESPLFTICTHGAHDVCCATRGRRVAAAVAAAFPTQTWEISHIGGDRFAANLLALPLGAYFGRVPAEHGADVAAAVGTGRLALRYFRGRACHPPPVQAADWFARDRFGLELVDELSWSGTRPDGDVTVVAFRRGDNVAVEVRLRVGRAARPRRLSCHVEHEERPPVYDLLEVSSRGRTPLPTRSTST